MSLSEVGTRKQTLIVGFGRSGRELHLRCLRKMQNGNGTGGAPRRIGIIDVDHRPLSTAEQPDIEAFKSLEDARPYFDTDTVVHVCTPPPTHLEVLREAARYGYSRVIVEKPLVSRLADLAILQGVVKEHRLTVFVVANWLSSALTGRLRERLQRSADQTWSKVTISQIKPRFARSLATWGQETIFDVEIPHQIALALVLGGADLEVRHAECSDMVVNRTRIPHMGQATITMEDKHGRVIVLHSDLTAPFRQRSVEVLFENGTRSVGYYPSTDADSFSQLLTFHRQHDAPVSHEIFVDEPLSAFLHEVYDYFEHDGRRPASDVDFNAAVVSTIAKAKATCGLRG
jgi:predicted dehydrogenase